MTDRVGIIGVNESIYEQANEASLEELVHRTARGALEDASIERSDLDSVVACASDLEDGRAISSMVTAGPAGSYNTDFIKSTDTGIHALGLATMRIETGIFDTSLVISWGKQSETDLGTIRELEGDPFYRRGTGLGYLTGHGAQAVGYSDTTDGAVQAANRVVEKNTMNRRSNSRAVFDHQVTKEQVAKSPVVAWPIREAHLPPYADGACALVIADETTIQEIGKDPIWIDGIGWETDTYNAGNRPFGQLPALSGAAKMAFDDAGVETPSSEIDIAEIHSRSAFHELIALERLSLDRDSVPDDIFNGRFDRDGELPVCPSGGPFSGDPLIATGLARVATAAEQARGDAGNCQVDRVNRALAHSTAGFTDQTHGVTILEGGKA